MKTGAIFLLLLLTTISCEKDDNLIQNLFVYDQTSCSDPWKTGQNNSADETSKALRDYFKNLGVPILEVDVKDTRNDDFISCEACSCTTGIQIIIMINEKDHQKVINLGFRKME